MKFKLDGKKEVIEICDICLKEIWNSNWNGDTLITILTVFGKYQLCSKCSFKYDSKFDDKIPKNSIISIKRHIRKLQLEREGWRKMNQ